MAKIFSFCTVILLALFAGCDNPSEPILNQDKASGGTETTSLTKWGSNNYDHDRNCDRDHDRDEDCNSKGGYHDKNCDRFHDRNSDRCNTYRVHSAGCTKTHDYNESCSTSSGSSSQCDSDGTVTLWAGKNTNVGTVVVTQDQNYLYVEYKTSSTWKIKETHLDISTQKYTQRGSPGQYDYQSSNGSGVASYKYKIHITWAAGTKIYFLAHAVVGKYSSNSCGSTETAYGGTIITPNNGSWYGTFCYTIHGTPPPTYVISGYTFIDLNGNGIKDVGELGLANVGVSLSNGSTTTSNAAGAYSFSGVNAGSYTVTSNPVSGFNQTSSSSAVVTISSANVSANFGYSLIPSTFSISGIVFYDTNLNGLQDVGEAGVASVVITLNGTPAATTDANGYYSITNLTSAQYVVASVSPNADWNLTTAPSISLPLLNASVTGNFGWAQYSIPDVTAEVLKRN